MKTKYALEYADVDAVAAACRAEAERLELAVSFAVVDDGGYVLRIERMDGTGITTPMVALAKARTSVFMRGPTGNLAARVRDEPELLRLDDYFPMQGGFPIMVNGQCVGAIGVSGARPDQDEEIARAGAVIVEAGPTAS